MWACYLQSNGSCIFLIAVVLNWDEEEEESSQEEEEMEGSFKEESPVKRPTRAGSKLATTAKKEKEEVAGAEPSLVKEKCLGSKKFK